MAVGAVLDAGVHGDTRVRRRELPDLDAVHILNVGARLDELGRHLPDVEIFRRAFEQDVARLAQEAVGGITDETGDSEREQRIDPHPAPDRDDARRDDRRH